MHGGLTGSAIVVRMDPHDVAARLGLEELPGEGGLFRRTFADDAGAAIYYMMIAPARSAPHRLDVAEVWHHYAGGPARLLLLHPDGTVERLVLGRDLADGQEPQVVVPAGTWQAAEPLGEWTLAGCTTAPPFDWDGWRLGQAHELVAGWPDAADDIRRLAAR